MNFELQKIIDAENECEIKRLHDENIRLKAENKKLRNDYYTVVDRLSDVTEAYAKLQKDGKNELIGGEEC